MPRLLIPICIAIAAVVALLLATDLNPFGEPLEADPDAPLAWEENEPDAPGQPPAPVLSAATAAKARRAARRALVPEGTEPSGPTGPYEFTVIDAETEAPIEDVVFWDDAGENMGATDEDGLWSIADAGVARLSFTAVKEGYVIHRGIASPGGPVEIVLHGGIAIRGLVVRAGGEVGVGGASVRAWDLDFGREIAATTTDEKGFFTLPAVRPHHPVTIITTVAGLVPDVRREIFGTLAPEEYLIRVGGGGRLEGHVFDATGKPAKRMAVWLMPAERRPFAEGGGIRPRLGRQRLGATEITRARTGVTHTDDVGRYAFEGVPLLRAWQPAAFPAARHIVRGETLRFSTDGEERTADITLIGSATLALSLKDAQGRTMSHAEIRIHHAEGTFDIETTDHWKEDVLTIEGLTPGGATVTALLPGRPRLTHAVKLLDGTTTTANLAFKAGGELVGTVKDRAGRPIWKALVRWHVTSPTENVEVRTDQQGNFRLVGLQGAEGLLRVSARDLPHVRRTYESWKNGFVRPGEGAIHVTLKNGTTVTGRFPDLKKGSSITCRMLAGAEPSDWGLRIDERGGFRRDGPEAYTAATFVFYLRGYPPLLVREHHAFGSEETRDLGPLAFEQTNPRKGRVLGPDSKPIHGAKVSVRGNWSGLSTRTDTSGDFVFARLPDTPINIRIEADGYPPTNVTLNTTSQFRHQLFRLSPGTQVWVTVVAPSGKPAEGCHIIAQKSLKGWKVGDPTPTPVHQRADAKGFTMLWLPNGAYTITALMEAEPPLYAAKGIVVPAPTTKKQQPRTGVEVRLKLGKAPR